jgi:hypothetical protein
LLSLDEFSDDFPSRSGTIRCISRKILWVSAGENASRGEARRKKRKMESNERTKKKYPTVIFFSLSLPLFSQLIEATRRRIWAIPEVLGKCGKKGGRKRSYVAHDCEQNREGVETEKEERRKEKQ